MEANEREAIGQRIKQQRKAAGETQQELGAAVDVVQQSVAAWEAGRCLPDIPSLVRIAKHYHVSTDQLLGLNGELLQYPDASIRGLQRDMEAVSFLTEEQRCGILALIRLERAGFVPQAN